MTAEVRADKAEHLESVAKTRLDVELKRRAGPAPIPWRLQKRVQQESGRFFLFTNRMNKKVVTRVREISMSHFGTPCVFFASRSISPPKGIVGAAGGYLLNLTMYQVSRYAVSGMR
jgi:hypothetical protein